MANVLVFPSNTNGRHDHGLAKHAVEKWGAQKGVSDGPSGFSYAVPVFTDSAPLKDEEIEEKIKILCDHARENIDVNFFLPPLFPMKRKSLWGMIRKYGAPPNILFTADWCKKEGA